MPKANDIVGTIRIPEAGYGRFWNFMKTMPGSEFTPSLDAAPATPKREKGSQAKGNSSKCIVLAALPTHGEGLTAAEIGLALEKGGKSKLSGSNVITELKAKKLIVQRASGQYLRSAKGTQYMSVSCPT